MSTEAARTEGEGAPTYIVEAVVAALIILLGVVVLYGSSKLGSGWTSDGPGAGYFPFYIGLILCISGAAVFGQALVGKLHNKEPFVDREQLGRVMSVLIPAVIYVVVMQVIGLYIASAIYIAVFMIWLGKYSPVKSVILALAVMVVFYALVEIWFQVPLFKGALAPLERIGL